jgi:hypothetical protein
MKGNTMAGFGLDTTPPMPPHPLRILVCGGREWADGAAISCVLRGIGAANIACVIHGACRGADTLAEHAARALGIAVERYPADWEKHGKQAGAIRNRQMLTEGKPDMVIAFHADIKNSTGTKDMVVAAFEAGIYTLLIANADEAGAIDGAKNTETGDTPAQVDGCVLDCGVARGRENTG